MSIDFQNLIVFVLIAGALGFFVVRWWKARRGGGGCSGGCCPAASSHKPEPIFRRADGGGKGEAGISITDGGDGDGGGDGGD